MGEHRNGGNHLTASKGAAGALGGYRIDASTLIRRLQCLYSHWREHREELWGSCNAFAVATPPPSHDIRYLKSSALNIWLLGYELPETVMVFTDKHIHFLCSQKEASVLDVLKKSAKEAVNVDVVMHVKGKNVDRLTQMDAILRSIESLDSPVLGYIAREAPEGKLLEKWTEKMKSSGLQFSDITNGLADLFAVKESVELLNVKKAAYLTASVMKEFVVPQLENVIDDGKKVTHSSLMDDTEKVISEPARIKVKLKADNVDICYPPIFQSGGKFNLRPSASSNDDHLYYDSASVIICALGSQYNRYCANVARTFFINSNATQSKAYQVLLKAHRAAVGALKPGNKASDVYKAALAVVEKEAPGLTSNLTKSAGAGIGLEFRESGLSLNEKNERMLKVGMVLNVSLGFQNLQTKTSKAKSQNYALLIADTVIVTASGHDVVTSLSSKDLKDVSYFLNNGEKEDGEKPQIKVKSNLNEAQYSKTILRSDNKVMSKEELRRQNQADLAQRKNEETAQRLAGGKSATGDGRSSSRTSSDLIAYKNINDVPRTDLMIQVDQRNEAILIPLYGSMVPFHVATVKTVTSTSQADTSGSCYIRIVFNVPGTPFSSHDPNSAKNQKYIFLKEVSFRSKDARHISNVVQQIKTLRKNVVSRESERAHRASLVTQEKLVLSGNKSKPIRLTDLWIRPSFPGRGRKLSGTLEAHDNGFRYSTSRPDERVDILFGNVKHAFFQAAEKEMITLLHFHLHNHIMVGNKKTKDVQFYVEVMDGVQTLRGGKRSAYDQDEIEEEIRERDRKNKTNTYFQTFVNRVSDLWGQPKFSGLELEFDQPLRELGFHGVPHKSSAFIVPTSSCLVELIETPFLVVTLSEIEIVNLERVGLGQKNFDMAIVFKDFRREVLHIDSIPSTSLEGIKEWLNTIEIKYYESTLNIKWQPILKRFMDNPQSFIDEGGWEFLNLEATDSDSDDSQESDQGYEPEPETDSDSDSDSDSDGSDSASLVESDDDEEEEEEEEEEGKTWEELEREASNADREKGDESDSEEERKRRKIKAFGKSRADPSTSALKRPKFGR